MFLVVNEATVPGFLLGLLEHELQLLDLFQGHLVVVGSRPEDLDGHEDGMEEVLGHPNGGVTGHGQLLEHDVTVVEDLADVSGMIPANAVVGSVVLEVAHVLAEH